MFCEIIVTSILSVCAIVITVCMGLLVYNNLAYTKKVASEKATEITQKAIREVYKNVKHLKDKDSQSFAMDLYIMAKAEKDRESQLIFLEEAENACTEAETDLKNRIRNLKRVLEKTKNNDAELFI